MTDTAEVPEPPKEDAPDDFYLMRFIRLKLQAFPIPQRSVMLQYLIATEVHQATLDKVDKEEAEAKARAREPKAPGAGSAPPTEVHLVTAGGLIREN